MPVISLNLPPKSTKSISYEFQTLLRNIGGTAVAQWLRCCATDRKVGSSIPDGVIGIFH